MSETVFTLRPVPQMLGQIVFHPGHEQPGEILSTISYLRQALEFLELRYQQIIRRPSVEEALREVINPPAPRKAARKQQTTGQGRGRPRKQAASNGAAEPPPAEPPLFPPPDAVAEHAA